MSRIAASRAERVVKAAEERPGPEHASRGWYTIPTRSGNGRTIGRPTSVGWTKRSTRPMPKGWTVVDMKDDWKRVFPFEE